MPIPGSTTKRGLSNPPILTTDVTRVNGSQLEFNHIMGSCRVPNGFLDKKYAGGLVMIYRLYDGSTSFDDKTSHGFAVHAPTQDVSGYSAGWKLVDSSEDGQTDSGIVAAQRRGQYVYGLTSGFLTGSGAATFQFGDRFHGLYGAERRHHDNSIRYEGLGGAASGATVPSMGTGDNADMFVSDHDPPRLWFLSGTTAGFLVDNGATWAYHWEAEDQRGFAGGSTDPFYPSQRFKFQFWHYYQDYVKPISTALRPALVHPWSAGDYGDPEMWWAVPEQTQTGSFTQRLRLYRSRWSLGTFREDRGYVTLTPRYVEHESTPPGQVGQYVPGRVTLMDTSSNTNDVSFEHDWFDDSHYVGTVGPFRGVTFGGGIDANRVIRVTRDPRRSGRLVFGLFQNGSAFGDGWDGAWYAVSPNDGASWGRARQMNPFAKSRNGMTVSSYRNVPSMTVAKNGEILVPAASSFDGKASHSFAVVNYDAASAGSPDRERIVWRRGEGGEQ